MASNLRKRKETQKVKSAGGQVIHTADRTASGAVAPHQQRESNPDVREEFRKRVQESIGADMTAGVRGVLPTAQRAFDRTEAVKRRQSNKDGRLYITQHPERNLNPYAPKQPQQNPYAGGYMQWGTKDSPEFNALARLAQQAGEKRSKRYADYMKDSAEAMGRKIDLPGFGMRYPGLAAQEYGKQHSDLDADTEYIRNKQNRNLSGASDAVRPGKEENEIFKGRGILAPNDRILQNALLSDEQKRTYNYIYATQGAEEAEKFRDTALEEGGVNAMIAQKAFDADLRNSSYPGKIAATYIGGVEGAADSLAGVPGMVKGEEQYRPRSTAEYFTSEAVRSEPEGSLARTGLELAQSAGTNTLAHLASVAGGPALGSAVFAAQAGSRAYNESLMEGHTVGEATAYGAMQALDEEITNYLLGGLSAYGGGAVQRTIGRTPIAQMVGKELQGLMQTETGRYAMRQLMDAIASNSGEAAQEYLQHFTEEFEKWVAYNHTSYDVTTPEGRAALANDLPTRQQIAASLTDPEALHEALIGFLNAGLMNAPGQITEAADIMNRGQNSDLGNMGYGAFADAIDVNPLNYSNPDTYHEARDLRNLAQEYERRNTAGMPTSTFDRGIIDRAAYEFAAHAAEDPRQMARAAYDPYAGEIDSTTPEEPTREAERTPPAEEPVPETVEKLRPKEMQPEVTAPTESAAKRLTPEEADAARARWNAEQAERKRDIPDRPYARDEVAYRQLTSEEADAARGELKRLQDEAAAYRADREARAASPRGETTIEGLAEAVTGSVRPTSDIYGDYLARKAEYGAKKAQNDRAMSEALAGTFGKEGKKAFAEIPAERSAEAYREFAAYYNSERFGTQAPAEAQTLTPEQVTAAMKAGALDANAAYPADTMKATARSVQRIQVDGVNAGVADRSSINYDALTPQQKLRVDFTDAYITKGLGMDVRYIQSDAVNGNYEGINGSFSVVNGRPTITLDVNAGMNRESDWTGDVTDMQTMLPVISHEITHFLEKSAPEAYKAISDAVIKSLANNRGYTGGYTINQIVRAEINRMDRTEKGADGKPIKHTEADALHEIVARACEDMLSGDTKAVQTFEALDTQTKATLWDHIKGVLDNIREFFQQMLSSYKSDSAEAKAIRQNMDEFERIRSMWQEALNGGTTTVSASEANTTQAETAKEAFSVRQFANSLDFDVRLTGEGQAYEIIDPKTGKAVKHVTPKMMEQTPMGVLVQAAFDAGTINKKTANRQLKMFSDLMNLTLKYDPGSTSMVWEIAGTYLFSSVKTNSDKQYSTTIDYGTICAKTQALIDVLSKTMVQKGRGLTREEVLTAYNKTAGVGLSVPCPVCYVFSRWMGVPSLLETMRKCQDRFSNASDKEVQDYIKSMLDEYKTAKGVNEAKTKVQNRLATLERRLQEALENGDSKAQEDVRKEVSELEKKMSDLESFNWVTQVRCVGDKNGNYKLDKGYRPVPNEILLDLTKSGDFAKQFPKAWKYRTTRGAGMGKAIVPYSGATLGDFIKGTKDRWASTKNPFFNKNPKAARAAITRAATRARAQNMIGGQRFQSTSDFRAEWGIDYLMTFLECQAAGSQVQLYTKVIEAVDMFASAGAEVNLSIMPKGDGYENGRLVFSDITGVNFENALEKTRQYDNVQMILVGINDDHIRMAMADDRITFIIPWHPSGNSKETLATLMQSVGETLSNATSYEDSQNDKIIDNSAEAKAARQLRKDIIQGKLWADYKTRKAAKLTDAQQAILDGNTYLKELYRKFYVDKSAKEYGVKLNGNQSAGIFPYEYWDTSLTIKDADQNGRRFQEYCASLGIQPRFPQFANDPGYWKTLIDRRMYNRDGTYHEPSAIDVTNVKIEQVPQAVNSNNYKDMDKIDQATMDTIHALDDRQSDLATTDDVMPEAEITEGRTQYSLRMVDEVKPSSDAWKSGFTTDQAMEVFPDLWNVAAEGSDTKNPTSVKVTLSSYRKIYDQLKAEGFNGTIMDASSGLGYGTEAGINDYGFDVEDIEPYPGERHEPTSRDYSSWDKTYDIVISNAVLNVLPQEQRDAMVAKIGEMLNPGGRAFVNVRSVNDVKAAKSKLALDAENGEYVITSTGSYQKGFSEKELTAYLRDALGDGYTVTPATKKFGSGSNVWAEIHKDSADASRPQYSTSDTTGKQLTNAQAEYFKDSKARDAEGRLLTLYHGTEFAGFTEFKTERGVWLTTSKRDADSYGGNWEGKVFDPNEKPEIRRTNGKTYPVGEHMRFETKEDRDNFLKEYPDAESYLTERELRVKEAELDDDWEADDYDERSEELQELRKRSEKIGRAYARYELKHSGSTTIGEMLEDPSLYSLNDFKRVWLSIDREVSFDDEFEYYDSDEEYRDAIAERLRNYIEEGADDQEWHDEMLNDFAVKARIPAGRKGEIFNNTNNRTYELYANVVNPYVFDNHGRGSEFNGSFYHTIEKAMADPQYDGVIVENARVGRYQDLGTVVLVKNPNQVKLTTNENPSTSNDVRFSQRGVDHDAVLAELVEKYGALPKGENAQVDVSLPAQTSPGKKTRRYARTVLESGLMSDQMSDEIKKKVINEALSYEPMTDKASAEYAASVIKIGGVERAQREWDKSRRSDAFTKDDMAVGQFLLKEYASRGDIDNVLNMVTELAAEGTRMGQNIQAMRMLKKYAQQVPEIGLGYIQRTVDQMNRDAKKKMGKKYKEMKISPALASEYLNANTPDAVDAALGKIYKNLGEQVQKTTVEEISDRLRAWRYLSMLGNPRTHVRNLVGNAIFVPAVKLKNVIGAELEKAMKTDRTKSVTTTAAAIAFARQDALEMRDVLQGNADKSIRERIMDERKTYRLEALNTLTKANGDALETEDWWFLRAHYQDALAQYITANNLDTDNMDGTALARARKYAVNEAQKATYRDANAVSTWLSQGTKTGKAVGFIMEGMLPFKKTPTNILRRGVEYSPAGLVATLTKGTHDLNTGKITVNEYIDGIASGLSGTAIFGVGMFLASAGVILGDYDDDDDKERRKLRGDQEYSVRIGDYTYTVDWAAPGSLPLFVGVEVMNALKKERGVTLDDISKSVVKLIDPMINMSMLSGLNDTLSAISYSDNKLPAIASEAFYSLLGQFVPTILGQVARTVDTTQRINYQDKNTGLPKDMLYFMEKVQNKIPLMTFSNDPYLNEFGQENVTESRFIAAFQNFISPGYISKVKDDKVLDELDRLSEAQDENVLPKKMPKYLDKGENRIDLTSEQYTTFQRTAGQLSYNILDNMVDDPRYGKLTVEEQAEAISAAYSYAKAVGRIAVQPEYEKKLTGTNKKVYNAVKSGKQAYDAILDTVTK